MAEPVAAAPYVFLSYAGTDREQALSIADALTAAGIGVWVDRRSLIGGMSWDAAIVRAIKDCAVFAVLCTPAGVASPNVMQELRLAWEEQRPTLPLRLAALSFPDEMRYILAGRQWVEAVDRPDEVWLPDLHNALAGLGVRPRTVPPSPVPVSALSERPPTNLPTALTRFLGRGQELADLAALLANHRLVTLTGPGGTGKTRLAISAAELQTPAFPDGTFFVDLAPLADPTLVPSAVAQTLGVQGFQDVSLSDSVLRFLQDKRLLLVLDNFEQLLAAAAFVGALLQTAPALTVLVTSRAPLRIPGEREYAVQPLPLLAETAPAAALAENPAVALFVSRAQDVRADFGLTAENAATVAAICTRLDGLPLAIELAAARVRVLPPSALFARLTQRLPVLTGGARTVPARQQTLRGAISWSYDLLEPAEQQLFRRLGVFAGGCTLEFAGAVCNANGDLGLDVLDGVSSLVEKSLLRETDGQPGEPRYRMFETIREFALGELETRGEAETVRRQLAVEVLQLARRCSVAEDWPRLGADVDNARTVLGWCVERAELGVGVRLWRASRDFLWQTGRGKEEEEWRQRLLALPEAEQPNLSRAYLLAIQPLSSLLSIADQQRADAGLQESIALCRTLGDRRGLSAALAYLILLRGMQGRYEAIAALVEEALPLRLEAGDASSVAWSHNLLIHAALGRGDIAEAERLVAVNKALVGTVPRLSVLPGELDLAEAHGDDAQARILAEAMVQGFDSGKSGNSLMALRGLVPLGRAALRQGDIATAVAACARLFAVHQAMGPTWYLPSALNALAQAAERFGKLTDSACLLAAVDGQRRAFAAELPGLEREQQATVARVRAALGEAAFTEAWAAGALLSPEAAIEFGLELVAQLQDALLPLPQAGSDPPMAARSTASQLL